MGTFRNRFRRMPKFTGKLNFGMQLLCVVMTAVLAFAAHGQTKSNKTNVNSLNEVKQKQVSERILVIENISIIDAVSASAQPNKTVVIVNNRIKEIGKKGKVSVPKNAKIINGKGKFLIPGLWDSHVHLTSKKAYLPLFVANGVTSVREMGGDFQELKQMREQVAQGTVLGPRIKTAGTIIENEKWLKWALDMSKKDGDHKAHKSLSKRIGISSPEHSKEVIKKLAEDGVDLIKIRNAASSETFLAIVAEAKKYGLPVAAHAPQMDLANASADLGSIEHIETVSFAMQKQELQKIARAFAQNGTWYTPTLVTGINWRLTPKETLLELVNDAEGKVDKRNLYVTFAERQSWKFQIESQKNEGSYDWAAQTRKGMDEFRVMHKEGVGVLAGTDFGVLLIYPGFSLHDELEALVKEGGLTPFEALQSATRNPPYFFNLQNEIGTIEAGKIADLVLLKANPLENISNTKKIDAVILDGKYLSQADLQTQLNQVREQIQRENNQRKQQAQ